MAKVLRSPGTTESERYLARLADRTFLNLWAYPNVYVKRIVNRRPSSRELCDLLVVCGEHVLVFSDKNCGFPKIDDVDIAWARWFKKAVGKSVDQIDGARRQIEKHPDQIYVDEACTQKLPFPLPPADRMKFHAIIVARGAYEACSEYFGGDAGSFMLTPSLSSAAHSSPEANEYAPFAIGDIDPSGVFIHVMNELTLDIVMRELDTITDFTDYLSKKAEFVRSGRLTIATGEEELLAYYLTHGRQGSQHEFSHPENREWHAGEYLALDQGHYAALLSNEQYKRKKAADKDSYLWDRLIEAFTDHLLAGTTIVPDGSALDLTKNESAIRHMALEPRVRRRMLSTGVLSVLKRAHEKPRTIRAMIPTPEKPDTDVGYVFMTLALPEAPLPGGYEQYRHARSNMLLAYCMGIACKARQVKRVIGIACEPPPQPDDPIGGSEDMAFFEPSAWTEELEAETERLCSHYDILRDGNFSMGVDHVDEYPDEVQPVEEPVSAIQLNRKDRRALAARARRNKPGS